MKEKKQPSFGKIVLENAFRDLPNYVFCKDSNLVYQFCNEHFARYAGFRQIEEVIGKTDTDMPWGKTTADLYTQEDTEILKTGESMPPKEVSMSFPGEEDKILLVSKKALRNNKGSVVGILGIYIDITDRKKQEQELTEARERAEESDRIKSEFISNMEHDIRTPFVGVYGMVKFLADQEDDSEKKSMLRDVELCAKELMDYCDGIVSFSRVELGTTPVISKIFKLKKLIDSVYVMEVIAARAKKIDFSFSYDEQLPEVVIGDSSRLKRILINLISNAIKFTKTGHIKLSASLDHKELGDRKVVVKFAVEDTGVGIPKDKQVLIYERFTKLTKSNTGLHAGLGLGLSIVKQFVDELDGDIYLESEIGKGSIFSIYLAFKIPLSNNMNVT